MAERFHSGIVIDDGLELSLIEVSQFAGRPAEWVVQLVDEGIIEPVGTRPERWRFRAASLRRGLIVRRLERDLGVNLPGAALALELLEEVRRLRARASSAS